jgi:hypothetical protein
LTNIPIIGIVFMEVKMAGKGKKATAEEDFRSKKLEYDVKVSRRLARKLGSLPPEVQDRFEILVEDLKEKGALRTEWPNYSPLENDYYHCHLNRNWVAVWQWKKGSIVISVEYVGSRGEAPYAR